MYSIFYQTIASSSCSSPTNQGVLLLDTVRGDIYAFVVDYEGRWRGSGWDEVGVHEVGEVGRGYGKEICRGTLRTTRGFPQWSTVTFPSELRWLYHFSKKCIALNQSFVENILASRDNIKNNELRRHIFWSQNNTSLNMSTSSVISSYCQVLNMLHVNRILLPIICNIFKNLFHLSYLFSYCFILRSLLLIFFNNLFIRSLSHLN